MVLSIGKFIHSIQVELHRIRGWCDWAIRCQQLIHRPDSPDHVHRGSFSGAEAEVVELTLCRSIILSSRAICLSKSFSSNCVGLCNSMGRSLHLLYTCVGEQHIVRTGLFENA